MRFRDLNPDGSQFVRHLNPMASYDIGETVTILTPFNQDRMHMNGIGFCQTILGWDAASAIEGLHALTGRVDLTGKEMRLRIRPFLDQHDYKLSLFVQTIMGMGRADAVNIVSAWVSQGQTLKDGVWNDLVYKFENFRPAGNNLLENTHKWRYDEYPFEDTLNHLGTFALSFTDGEGPITGAIQLDTFDIV